MESLVFVAMVGEFSELPLHRRSLFFPLDPQLQDPRGEKEGGGCSTALSFDVVGT